MNDEYDLPEILAGIFLTIDECPEFWETTVDDFYDMAGIPTENRSDYVTDILGEQATALWQNSN